MNKWSYWIKNGLLYILYIAIGGVLFGMFQSFIAGEFTLERVAETGLYYALPLSSILICFMNILKTIFMANIVISMGETRKNTIMGINIMNLTALLTAVITIFVLSLITDGKLISMYTAFVSTPAIYLVAIGCGMVINSINRENTNQSSVLQSILMILVMILLFGLHTLVGTFLNDNIFININDNIRLATIIISAVSGIILCIIGNIRMKKKLMFIEISL